jgi:enoyl-CoA hydratase/carnithine racemase
VPQAELGAAVERWTADIIRCSPVAVQASKEVAYRALEEPSLEQAMHHQKDYPAFRTWLESEDLREGLRAFTEKRRPSWPIPPSNDESDER